MLDEGIVLFGRTAGEGLEPVGVMTGSHLQCPLFHAFGDAVGCLAADRFMIVDSFHQCIVGLQRKILKHLLTVEHLCTVVTVDSLFGKLHFHSFVVGSFLHAFKS